MKHYGLNIAEGSSITNITIPSGTSFPTNDTVGELFYRTDTDTFNVRRNATWESVPFSVGGLANIVEDLTPQLGADLDINDFVITNGTASLDLNDTTATLFQSANGTTGQQFSIFAGTGSAGAGGLLALIGGQGTVVGGAAKISGGRGTAGPGGNVILTPGQSSDDSGGGVLISSPIVATSAPTLGFSEGAINGTEAIFLKSPDSVSTTRTWVLPVDDPSVVSGQFITTDASGNLSFTTASGGLSNIVEDTTPQLGGNLESNGNDIIIATSDKITITDVPVDTTDAVNKSYVDDNFSSLSRSYFYSSF